MLILCFSLIFYIFFSKGYDCVLFGIVYSARLWACFNPRPFGMLRALEEQDENCEKGECGVRSRRESENKQCLLLFLEVVVQESVRPES